MPSFSPRFVKAAVSFKLDDKSFDAGERLVNTEGVPGFDWSEFNPLDHVGKRVACTIKVRTSTPWELRCEAVICCEQTAQACALGLRILPTAADRARLDAAVAAEGELPEFVRKFPRLQYMPDVPVFPSRAVIRYFYKQEDLSIACDIDNLSPTGLQVFTEDNRTLTLQPDELVRVQIQPRGNWLKPIMANAHIKRIIHTIDPNTGNKCRYFGLSIGTMSGEAKTNFADMLRQILAQARAKAAGS